MWENRCKVAVSGVGFSNITRSAEVPLAAHALQAVQAAGCETLSIAYGERDLEQLFMRLTDRSLRD